MKKDLEHTLESLRREGLSAEERTRMRGFLNAYMHEHPARAPLGTRILDAIASWTDSSRQSHLTLQMRPAFAMLVLVTVLGTGTSYAAEQALPGDALYSVKTEVNERVRASLAIGASQKAAWNAERASKRLREAETLAAEGRLTPEARASLETGLAKATQEFDASVAVLAASDTHATTLAEVQSDIEASFTAHADVLSAISVALPASSLEIEPILSIAIARAETANTARGSAEVALSSKSAVREAAFEKKHAAEGELQGVRALAGIAKVRLGTVTSVEVDASASGTAETIRVGNALLQTGDYGNAFSTYQAAIRTARETNIGVEAASRLKTRIETALLSQPDTGLTATMMMTMDATTSTSSAAGIDTTIESEPQLQ